jgi:hypothetical protein
MTLREPGSQARPAPENQSQPNTSGQHIGGAIEASSQRDDAGHQWARPDKQRQAMTGNQTIRSRLAVCSCWQLTHYSREPFFQAGHAGWIPVIRAYSSQLIQFIRPSIRCFVDTIESHASCASGSLAGPPGFPVPVFAVSASSLPMPGGQDPATALVSARALVARTGDSSTAVPRAAKSHSDATVPTPASIAAFQASSRRKTSP